MEYDIQKGYIGFEIIKGRLMVIESLYSRTITRQSLPSRYAEK